MGNLENLTKSSFSKFLNSCQNLAGSCQYLHCFIAEFISTWFKFKIAVRSHKFEPHPSFFPKLKQYMNNTACEWCLCMWVQDQRWVKTSVASDIWRMTPSKRYSISVSKSVWTLVAIPKLSANKVKITYYLWFLYVQCTEFQFLFNIYYFTNNIEC